MLVQPRSLACPSRLFFVLPLLRDRFDQGIAHTQDQAYSCTGVTFADG
jgi:hypothetical protein